MRFSRRSERFDFRLANLVVYVSSPPRMTLLALHTSNTITKTPIGFITT